MAKGFKDFLKNEANKELEIRKLLINYAAQGSIEYDTRYLIYSVLPKYLENVNQRKCFENERSRIWIDHILPDKWALRYVLKKVVNERYQIYELAGAHLTTDDGKDITLDI